MYAAPVSIAAKNRNTATNWASGSWLKSGSSILSHLLLEPAVQEHAGHDDDGPCREVLPSRPDLVDDRENKGNDEQDRNNHVYLLLGVRLHDRNRVQELRVGRCNSHRELRRVGVRLGEVGPV